ncbi:NAD-dependent epimerase/dehydratase family protein [Streptomyces sp. NPDC057718]|uniref:NAD-dependent epimerase/dehydratase family protein n=1 Tax=Streptomyces sp. NPDC057718 TaxID=3346225 RepID=UPI003685CB18
MNIFVIGATGFVGGHLARHLLAEGHTVTGLARTGAAADGLAAQGITPVAGDLSTRRPAVVKAALRADAVIYAAQADPEQETGTVQDLTRALAGTGRTLVFLSGSGVLLQRTEGAWSPDVFAEDDAFTPEPLAGFRKAAEDTVLAAAGPELRAMVIRPGLIWGPGDHGHMSMIYRSVAETGAAAYVGEGLNTYSHVHVDDVARLFALALDKGRAGGSITRSRARPRIAGLRKRSPQISASRPAVSHPSKQSMSGASSAPSSWPPPAASALPVPSRNWAGGPSTPTCSP